MIKFLHTADWQLGRPFASVDDAHKRSLLQQERVEAVKRMGDIVRREEVAFVVVAGDLFDSTRVDKAIVSAACSAIGGLQVPVFVIPGNHDHGGPGSIWEQEYFLREQKALAPNLRILLEPKPVELDNAVLLPCPLLRRAESGDTTAWLRSQELHESLPAGKARIVIAHGSTQSFTGRPSDEEGEGDATNLLNLESLPEAQIDYIALGDWHGTKNVTAAAWYAGTPELDRFPKGEGNQPGHVLLVEVARGQPPLVALQPTARFHWRQWAFHFSDDASLEQFDAGLFELLGQRAGEDLLRLFLSGTLGIEAATELEQRLEALGARLLRLKVSNDVVTVPNNTEIEAITRRSGDPLIARVAEQLVAQSQGTEESATIARLALRELYAACAQSLK